MLVQTFTIVAPVFLLIGIGYALARFKAFDQSVGAALGQFVYAVSIPALIFRTLIGADLSAGLPLSLWASYFLGVAAAWTLGSVIIRKGFARDARAGVIGGISAAFANTVLVGLPVISAVYGEDGLVPLLLIVSIHLATMTIIIAVCMERAAAMDRGEASPPLGKLVAGAGKSLLTNPLIIAIVLAFVWRLTGTQMPEIPMNVVDRIGSTALPLALLSLGMSLVQYGMRGTLLPGLLLSMIKVAVMPAAVFVFGAFVFHLPPLWTAVATVTASCPTGVNAYIFANRYGTGHAMSANTITTTTLCAIATTSLWVWFMQSWFTMN